MTNLSKASRCQESSNGGEDSLLSALWAHQAHSFPRLPAGAPAAIAKDTIEVKDPERVYRIYRASRRHQFQLLVEAFILQIRYGCCAANSSSPAISCHCSTPTCFTYRRRAAGSKPIRRFNSISARQLAVTLASRDNPESALCAHLRSQQGGASNKGIKKHSKQVVESDPKKSIEALNEALIKSGRQPLSRAEHTILDGHDEGSARDTDLSCSPARSKTKSESVSPPTERRRTAPKPHIDKWAEEQRDVRIDPKSFVQNVFNTDAMRMLEWLTPSSVDGLTSRIKEALSVSSPKEDERSKQQHAEKGATVDVSKATTTETKQAIPIAATDFFRKIGRAHV